MEKIKRQKLNITLTHSTVDYLKTLSNKHDYPVSRIIEDLVNGFDSRVVKDMKIKRKDLPY